MLLLVWLIVRDKKGSVVAMMEWKRLGALVCAGRRCLARGEPAHRPPGQKTAGRVEAAAAADVGGEEDSTGRDRDGGGFV